MTDTDQEKEDEVLRRMLKTPPKPHEPTTPRGRAQRVKKGGKPKPTPKDQTRGLSGIVPALARVHL
jgi:hypothetical protein